MRYFIVTFMFIYLLSIPESSKARTISFAGLTWNAKTGYVFIGKGKIKLTNQSAPESIYTDWKREITLKRDGCCC